MNKAAGEDLALSREREGKSSVSRYGVFHDLASNLEIDQDGTCTIRVRAAYSYPRQRGLIEASRETYAYLSETGWMYSFFRRMFPEHTGASSGEYVCRTTAASCMDFTY